MSTPEKPDPHPWHPKDGHDLYDTIEPGSPFMLAMAIVGIGVLAAIVIALIGGFLWLIYAVMTAL